MPSNSNIIDLQNFRVQKLTLNELILLAEEVATQIEITDDVKVVQHAQLILKELEKRYQCSSNSSNNPIQKMGQVLQKRINQILD